MSRVHERCPRCDGELETKPKGLRLGYTVRPRRRGKLADYRDRNELLRDLGFESYRDYLASELWASIRARALERDGGLCRICGQPANQVHHQRYDRATLLGENLAELLSLCSSDHERIEFANSGQKVGVSTARKRLRKFAKKLRGRRERADLQHIAEREPARVERLLLLLPSKKRHWNYGVLVNGVTYDFWCHQRRIAVKYGAPAVSQRSFGKQPILVFGVADDAELERRIAEIHEAYERRA